jgi:hypothetical protein
MRPSTFNSLAKCTRQPRCILEARRVQQYADLPVPDGWHEAYACGEVDTGRYQHCRGRYMTHD